MENEDTNKKLKQLEMIKKLLINEMIKFKNKIKERTKQTINEIIKPKRKPEERIKHLINELVKFRRKPEGRITYFLLSLGFLMLTFAAFYEHMISAFIGISLTFWGILFFYIRPTSFIQKKIFDSTLIESTRNLNSILEKLDYRGPPTYVSHEMADGRKRVILCISKVNDSIVKLDMLPPQEEGIVIDPHTIIIHPVDNELTRLLEDALDQEILTMDLEQLREKLKEILVYGLEVADDFELEASVATITVKIHGTVFYEVLEKLHDSDEKNIYIDPLSNAFACIFSKFFNQPIIIDELERISTNRSILITYKNIDTKTKNNVHVNDSK